MFFHCNFAIIILHSVIVCLFILIGASAVGSIAIPTILRYADLIETGAMFIEFTSFFILVYIGSCFHCYSLKDDW